MKSILPKGKKLIKPDNAFWKYCANFFALVAASLAIIDWNAADGLRSMLFPACIIYIAALAIYCGEKEFERWNGYYRENGEGGTYVTAWTVLMLFLFLSGIFDFKDYRIPSYLIALYITVLAFFEITRWSKARYEEASKRKKTR